MRVLLIEDDHVIGIAVRDHIAADGHGVDWTQRLEGARDALSVVDYELILLDMSLPDGRGMDLLGEIRGRGTDTPIIIITAHDQISSRIEGLNKGADDYLVKPFDLAELSARVAAVARRYNGAASAVREFGAVSIDCSLRHVEKEGRKVDVTAREWAVLERLTRKPNATVSKPEIEDSLYAFGAEVESNTVEVYVSRLRRKLGRDFIRTVRGLGYQVPV
ncbi:MAG: response regulator [Paracoccaceae bacterium]